MTIDARVITGDCLVVLPTLDASSVDAIVTDPPYGLSFMGKAWDHGVPGVEFWTAALRVAKPGAHLVAFGGTRTFHRLTCAIEDAGFEIRDCLSWLYGSGFPKSHNGAWGGTALKPAWEPIILARKPLIGTVAANHAEHGTGALNIDGCRIEGTKPRREAMDSGARNNRILHTRSTSGAGTSDVGRWPANVVLDEAAAALLDAQSGDLTSGKLESHHERHAPRLCVNTYGGDAGNSASAGRSFGGDTGGGSRFFYTAKAGRAERNAGLDGLPERRVVHQAQTLNNGSGGLRNGDGPSSPTRNHHPTVKPLDLMQWLCRLVTPKGGLILDPFCGSGSTGRATVAEGFRFIGIEIDEAYAQIARARITEYAPLFGSAGQ